MVINTTFHVEPSVEKDFIDWIHSDYLPAAESEAGLHTPLFMRILTPMEGGTGYAVQFQAQSKAAVDKWLETGQPPLLMAMSRKWGRKVMFFTTTMEKIK